MVVPSVSQTEGKGKMSKKTKKVVRQKADGILVRRFSGNVKRIRERLKLTQSEVARQLKTTPAAISKLEASDPKQRRNPSLEMVERIAKVYKVDPGQLFRSEGKRPKVARVANTVPPVAA